MEPMKDVFGRPVAVGSVVAFAPGGTHEFRTGVVVRFTPQKVEVESVYPGRYGKTVTVRHLRFPGNVAVREAP